MVRTGIATSESISEVLENAGTPLTYGATAESWREALTSISGEDESITPRETDGVTGWQSDNETVLKTFNTEAPTPTSFTVSVTFTVGGTAVEVENVKLDDIDGVLDGEAYVFADIEEALIDVELSCTYEGTEHTFTKSYSADTEDIVALD